jgi:hypothetical protein
MSKRSKSRPVEELNLTYRRRSQDIEEVYSEMFRQPAAPVVPFPAPPEVPDAQEADVSGNTGVSLLDEGALDPGAPELMTGGLELESATPCLDAPIFNTGVPEQTEEFPEDGPMSGTTTINSGAPEFVVGGPVLNKDAPGVNEGPPDFNEGNTVFTLPRVVKLREARSVHEGHTQGEQLVYETLWRNAKPYSGGARILTIGIGRLAPLVPMTYNNCQSNLRSLARKLAIEERPTARHNDGRTYIVYGDEDILQRRRAAGLTHVLRLTRSVRLVNPGDPYMGTPQLR